MLWQTAFGFVLVGGLPIWTILAHELGHAVPALLAGCRRVVVVVGRPRWIFRCGRLVVHIGFGMPRGVDQAGFMLSDAPRTLRAERIITLGGPIAGLVFLLGVALLLPWLPISAGMSVLAHVFLVMLAIDQGLEFLSNADGSDGQQWRVIRCLEREAQRGRRGDS